MSSGRISKKITLEGLICWLSLSDLESVVVSSWIGEFFHASRVEIRVLNEFHRCISYHLCTFLQLGQSLHQNLALFHMSR